ncbi:MAG TPA: S53 family serine peptidase [Gammaproteobacteria bacterium]
MDKRIRLRILGLAAAGALSAALAAPASATLLWSNTATHGIGLADLAITAQALGPLPANTPLHVVVGLRLRNAAQLANTISAVNTPGSASYGDFLTPAEFTSAHGPTAAQVQAVESYLASKGFTHVTAPANGMYVSGDGTAAAAQAAFNTPIWQYQVSGPNGAPSRTVYANTQTAQVPFNLGSVVLSVVGLQNVDTLHTRLGSWPAAAAAPAAPLSLPQIPVTLSPQNLWKIYDAGSVPAASGTTIAIFAEGSLAGILPDPANPSSPNDLRQFEAEYGLPQVPVEIVQVGPASDDTSGAVEWDMDTQESTGLAGDVAKLIVYDAASLSDTDLIPAFNAFVTEDRAQAGSASFGGCEVLEFVTGSSPLYAQIFQQAAAQGQTVFASTGDSGSACAVLGLTNGVPAGIEGSVEFPASDTYVVGAGGTTLVVDADFNVTSELAWDAGGGGTALFSPAPAWQAPFVPANAVIAALGGGKGVPDVAMDADFLLSPAGFVSGGADTSNGGTSLSSPLSLGAWARIQNAHGNGLGHAGAVLYSLGTPGLPFSSVRGFRDVVLGGNGLFVATPGWDFTTGLGSFDISAVSAAIGNP